MTKADDFSMRDKASTLVGNWTAAQLTMLKDFSEIEKQKYLAWLRAMIEVARLPYLLLDRGD